MMKRSPPVSSFATIALLAIAGAAGCSSGSDSPAAKCNPCQEAGTQPPAATNPDGIPYPNPPGGYGHKARSGSTPGSVIANLRFNGYVNGDTSKGIQVISLADYYDPCGKRLKLLHLSVAGVWCNPCNAETQALVAGEAILQQNQVVLLQALSDGPTEGVGASMTDLNYWVSHYKMTFTEMLDPGPTQFAQFFIAADIPWNGDVDPRTMELVGSATGWGGDVMGAIQPGLSAVAGAPLLSIPASACADQ
jgi:hypothetical protein